MAEPIPNGAPKSAPTPLVCATLSAFAPGAGQWRQGRKKMAGIMLAVLTVVLAWMVYEIITTYTGVFDAEADRMIRSGNVSASDIGGAVGAAIVACFKNLRIIAALVLLPFVHIWSMIDAYWAARE